MRTTRKVRKQIRNRRGMKNFLESFGLCIGLHEAGITISVWESMPKYVIVVSDRKETKCMCENVYDMIIVGSGPAGLTAGIYGKRAGLKVVILESGFIQGGQIVNTYEVDN
mgnify:CR=1 FL=1